MDHSTNREVIFTKGQAQVDGRAIDPMTNVHPRGRQRRKGRERRVRDTGGPVGRRGGERRGNDRRAIASRRWAEEVQVGGVSTGFLRVFAGPILGAATNHAPWLQGE